jgi:hypothetical protein
MNDEQFNSAGVDVSWTLADGMLDGDVIECCM